MGSSLSEETSTSGQAGAPPGAPPLLARPVRIDLVPGEEGTQNGQAAASRDVGVARVCALIPCHSRHAELELVLQDLGRLERASPAIDLRVVVVDNASDRPLSAIPAPPGVRVEHVRLGANTGGSGGFNAGIRHALGLEEGGGEGGKGEADLPDFLWLVDSDVRVRADALAALVRVLARRSDLCAVGSALADPCTGRIFEVGGMVDRRSGRLRPAASGAAGVHGPIIVDYVASCSALVRREAVQAAGLLPDVFLSTDDVQWCIRLARATGQSVGAVAESVVVHPRFDRFATGARYYAARNALGPLCALGLGARVRFRRAWREAVRAAGQEMMGRPDLAELHLRGLRDWAAGRATGPAPGGALVFEAFRPLADLGDRLRALRGPVRRGRAMIEHAGAAGLSEEQVRRIGEVLTEAGLSVVSPYRGGALDLWTRLLLGPCTDVAVVSPKGRPRSWLRGRIQVHIAPGACDGEPGFALRRSSRARFLSRAGATCLKGAWLSARAAARSPVPMPVAPVELRVAGQPAQRQGAIPGGPVPHTPAPGAPELNGRIVAPIHLPSVSVVILSHDRWGTLSGTLTRLLRMPALAGAQLIVVDNASTDGSAERTARQFPRVEIERLPENVGVAAFNRGVQRATGDVVLILDDDAWPDDQAVGKGLEVLSRRPEIGAVAFHPRHPETGQSEWPFAVRALAEDAEHRWPVMGCGNLVRRDLWNAVGGYEPGFFLYRNDVDMALKILACPRTPAAGATAPKPERTWGVYFDPAWIVWHQSPAARRKTSRWHRLATRNWIWMARRHGRGPGLGGFAGGLLVWAWAHRLAGVRAGAHMQTIRGAIEGWVRHPPRLGESASPPPSPTGRDFHRLVMLRLGFRSSTGRHRG